MYFFKQEVLYVEQLLACPLRTSTYDEVCKMVKVIYMCNVYISGHMKDHIFELQRKIWRHQHQINAVWSLSWKNSGLNGIQPITSAIPGNWVQWSTDWAIKPSLATLCHDQLPVGFITQLQLEQFCTSIAEVLDWIPVKPKCFSHTVDAINLLYDSLQSADINWV